MARGAADLAAELETLAGAGAAALARLRAGDEGGVIDMLERRERLLATLAACVTNAGPEVSDAARRAVALDAEIVRALEERRARVAADIEAMASRRRSLSSYGGRRGGDAVYVERLG